jgi:hypothetical protein
MINVGSLHTLSGVSCALAGPCTAVGSYQTQAGTFTLARS